MNDNPKRLCITGGISGIIGVIMLAISFNINPGPPPGATLLQLITFGQQNYNSILWGAWLQAVAPVFIILFAFSLVVLSGATQKVSGWMTFFGGIVLMIVSLIEITFYIAVMFKVPPSGILISLNVIYAVQHLYFIVAAPTLFFSLGSVLLGSLIISRWFGYLAILLAVSFATLGIGFLLSLVLPFWVTAFAGVQAFWWLAASIALIIRSKKISAMMA